MKSAPKWWIDGAECPDCGEVHPRCASHVQNDEDEGNIKRPCRALPMNGYHRCASHGGDQAKLGLEVSMDVEIDLYADIRTLMRRCAISTAGRTYVESLEDALHKSNTMVMLLGLLIETLAPKATATDTVVAEGTQRERVEWTVTREGMVGPDHQGDLQVHPWVTLYKEWVDTQARLAKVAADLGLTERQVQVAETQVQMMASTLATILTELGLDLHDPRTRKVIERNLLTMETQAVESRPALTGAATSS